MAKKLTPAGVVRMGRRAEQHFFLGVPKEVRRRTVRIYFEVLNLRPTTPKTRRKKEGA